MSTNWATEKLNGTEPPTIFFQYYTDTAPTNQSTQILNKHKSGFIEQKSIGNNHAYSAEETIAENKVDYYYYYC